MGITAAKEQDVPFLFENDRHIRREEIIESVRRGRILLLKEEETPVGWLRWNLFWDNTPFLTMLYLLEGFRGQGRGSRLVEFWEEQMKGEGYSLLMTSSQSDEQAQHFYRRHGYVDSGSLLLEGEPLEILFTKKLS